MRVWITLLLMLMTLSALSKAQVHETSLAPEHTVRHSTWDGAHGVVFFGGGLLKPTSLPIRSYSTDGSLAGSDINIFNDFPGVSQANLADMAVADSEKRILSVILGYDSGQRKYAILTYDSAGSLVSIWDTAPYFAWAVAGGDKGNVFAFEEKTGEMDHAKPYPMIAEYNSSGGLVRQFLYSSAFQNGSNAIDADYNQDSADPALMYRDGKLYIYAAGSNEVLICESDGRITRRTALNDVRQKLSAAASSKAEARQVGVTQVTFVDENHVLMTVYDRIPAKNVVFAPQRTYLVNLTTRENRLVQGLPNGTVLGVKDGQTVALEAPSDAVHNRGGVIKLRALPRD
jgi:hypothetical protein